ncbi:MAG: Crp/Fnr family transcriptional regulator [Alphaproteobacteria bacterium]|nr:Crp/Fnr family transcriptional regulator [Alphaproteobacteria bacterium]
MTQTPEAEKIIKTLKNVAIFKGCDDKALERLAANAHLQKHTKGHILFIHGDEAARLYLVQSGWVKLFRETLDGTQAVVDILTSGHLFGETSIFEDDIYPYSAEVVEPSEIISIPLTNLKTEIETNNKLALNMLSAMARYRRQQDREIEHLSIQNASQRIGCFLLRLVNQSEDGAVTIHLPYDKTLVASRLGMQPETFSRALAKLRDATGLNVKGATIELENLNQLVSYSCAACSSEFPCKDLQAAE